MSPNSSWSLRLSETRISNRILLCVLSAMACSARADLIWKELDYGLYGHLWNTDDGTMTGNPVGFCAPSSVVNSFQYLVNRYPSIYGSTDLIGDSLLETRDSLHFGWLGPGGETRDGSLCFQSGDEGIWTAKSQWVEDFAPGTTAVKGFIGGNQDTSSWAFNEDLLSGNPTWEWLWKEICDEEDVEIVFEWTLLDAQGTPERVAHMVTLTMLCFDDLDGDGIIDLGIESASMGFIDPNDPRQVTRVPVDPASMLGGQLQFEYQYGAQAYTASLRSAMSESPVPEGTTWLAICVVAGLGVARTIRRRTLPTNLD